MRKQVIAMLLLTFSSTCARSEESKPAAVFSPTFNPGECVATCERPKGEFSFKVLKKEEVESLKIKRPKNREALACEPKVQASFKDGCDVCQLFCNPN